MANKQIQMRGSYRVGTFFGISLYLHVTFLLVLALIAYQAYRLSGSAIDAVESVGFMVALFLCVVLHEYGHALTARYFDIKTSSITLLPIGGVAMLEKMPEKPYQEFLVAIMGPMVNVVIAAAIYLGLAAVHGLDQAWALLYPFNIEASNFMADLARINIMLVLFNMLPAFPMDGGRIFRSLLAMVIPYDTATALAAHLGRILALLIFMESVGLNVIPGFQLGPSVLLSFLALFVWFAAGAESNFVQLRHQLQTVTAGSAMITNFRTLSPNDSIQWAADLAASGVQQDFPIASDGEVKGILYQADIRKAMQQDEGNTPIRDTMKTDMVVLSTGDNLGDSLMKILSNPNNIIPVLNRGLLVGLVLRDRLYNLVNQEERSPAAATTSGFPNHHS